MNDDKILVSIRCLVYNHEPYLRQCLEGFVMQKTNFRFEAIVHDDASTDGSAKIIREYAEKYPDIIKPIYETENQYSKHDGSIGRITRAACKGKYMAMCEGDDYWIDPLKLQKQVDFLEKNLDYGMVYTKCKRYDQNSDKITCVWGGDKETFEDLCKGNVIPTLTVMFRKSLHEQYLSDINPTAKGWKMGDYPLWLYLSKKSKVKFLNEVTGVYRVLSLSASHNTNIDMLDTFSKSRYEILSYMTHYFGYSLDNLLEDDYYWDLAKNACRVRNRGLTLKRLKKIKTKHVKAKTLYLFSHLSLTYILCLRFMMK